MPSNGPMGLSLHGVRSALQRYPVGARRPWYVATANKTLKTTQTGITVTNLGAAGEVSITLPQNTLGISGLSYTFFVAAAQTFNVLSGAAGAFYINGAKGADSATLTSATIGDAMTVTSDGNGDWIVEASAGQWGVTGLDASEIGYLTSVAATTVGAGKSGTAGTVEVYPGTASKGKLTITAAAASGNTTTNINAAQMGQATTLTIPDPGGAAASFVLTVGTQTVSGALTLTGGLTITTTNVTITDKDIVLSATTGTKIGTATGQKLGFWNATPVVQQVLATGAGKTVDEVITLLQTLGLCKQA